MADEQKRPKIEQLELNRETIQDLTESEAERAQGGGYIGRAPQTLNCPSNICLDTVWQCSMEYCTQKPGCV